MKTTIEPKFGRFGVRSEVRDVEARWGVESCMSDKNGAPAFELESFKGAQFGVRDLLEFEECRASEFERSTRSAQTF